MICVKSSLPYEPGNANDRVKMFNLIKFLEHIRFSPNFFMLDMHSGEGTYDLTDGINTVQFNGAAATAINKISPRVDFQMNCLLSEANPVTRRALRKNMAQFSQYVQSLTIKSNWLDHFEDIYCKRRIEPDALQLIISDPCTMQQHLEVMNNLDVLVRNGASVFLYVPEDISPSAQSTITVGDNTFTQTQLIKDTKQIIRDNSGRKDLAHLIYFDVDYKTGEPKRKNHYILTSPYSRALRAVESADVQSKEIFRNYQELEVAAYRT